MFRASQVHQKNPVNFKQGQGMFTHQLKHMLRKQHVHKYNWDPLPMYDPRKLVHANREVHHYSYEERRDPHWDHRAVFVPDQRYGKIPVPLEFKDAYWWRDLQARRLQCPLDWVWFRFGSARVKRQWDFGDLAVRKKHSLSMDEVIANARFARN